MQRNLEDNRALNELRIGKSEKGREQGKEGTDDKGVEIPQGKKRLCGNKFPC